MMVAAERTKIAKTADGFHQPVATILKAFDRMTVPDSLPAIEETRWSADERHLWVRRGSVDDNVSVFDVVDTEGRWLGPVRVELSAEDRILEIGSDYVLTRWRNELGVNFLRQYRIRRPT